MNEKSLDGIFKHDNRKFKESLNRHLRINHKSNGRRANYHTRRFCKWINNTRKLGDKIITNQIQ